MLLTLKQTAVHNPIGSSYPGVHDYSSSVPSSTSRYAPAPLLSSPPPPPPPPPSQQSSAAPSSLSLSTPQPPLPVSNSPQVGMTAQPPHRFSLPPPPNMPQPNPLSTAVDHPVKLPAPPTSWDHRSEDAMRHWLQAKSEDDRRRQEEEKTRQEGYRLEQRRIEQSMLHESLERGIPPPMVPIIFAGLAGSTVPIDTTMQWSQHFTEAMRQQELQAIELRRLNASGSLAQSPYAATAQGSAPQSTTNTQPVGYLPQYQQSPSNPRRIESGAAAPPPTSAPRTDQARLPLLNTGEMQSKPPPSASSSHLGAQSGQPMHSLQPVPASQAGSQESAISTPSQQQQQSQQPAQQQSPNIYFYHWQPPNSGASGNSNAPTTPSEYVSSPPKRRKTSQHPTTSQPSNTSPSFSQTTSAASTPGQARRQAHSRNRSEVSTNTSTAPTSKGFESYTRPPDRNRAGSNAGPSSSGEHTPTVKSAAAEERRSSDPRFPSGLITSSSSGGGSGGGGVASSGGGGDQESRQEREQSQPSATFKRDDTRD